MKKISEYSLVISLTLIVLTILFHQFLIGELVFMSGDSLAPQAVKKSIQNIKNQTGSFPYWFPYVFSGMPTVHSLLNTNEFYTPHYLINFLYGLGMPWFWNFIFHYLFASVGMYKFLSFLKVPKNISILFGILFTTSPYMVAYLVHGHGSQIMTISYLPWIIYLIFKLHKKNNLSDFVILSLFIGFQLLRGHVQMIYYTWIMIAIYILVKFFFHYQVNREIKGYLSRQYLIIFSLFIGFLTSIKIYLPILNYSQFSTRGSRSGGFGIENATQWSLNFQESLTFILPYFYGFGGRDYWGFLPMTDFPNYIGIFILFLALLGFLKSNLKYDIKVYFGVVIVFSFLLSLGKNFISFYNIFYTYLPFFNKFRVPIFILIIFQFSIYIFAAFGLLNIFDLLKNKVYKNRIINSLVILIVLTFISMLNPPVFFNLEKYGIKNTQSEKIFLNIKNQHQNLLKKTDLDKDGFHTRNDSILLQELINNDYKLLNSQIYFQNSNQSKEDLTRILINVNDSYDNLLNNFRVDHLVIISILISIILLSLFREKFHINKKKYIFLIGVLLISDYIRVNTDIISPSKHEPNKNITKKSINLEQYLESDEVVKYLKKDKEKFRVLDLTNLDNMNRWAAFNIESISGYHPAKLNLYDKLLNTIYKKGGGYNYGLLQSLNIKYIIHTQLGFIENFEVVDGKFGYFSNNARLNKYEETFIYKNKSVLDRIFIVNDFEFVDNENVLLEKITSSDFNPINLSYLNKSNKIFTKLEKIKNNNVDSKRFIELVNWDTDKIVFKTDFEKPQLVALSEIYYPGWKFTNSNIEIFEINGLFRGFIIPSGEKEYTMEFKPNDLKNGLIISRITYSFIFLIIIFGILRKRNVEL
ncbi:MAG: hypothetical protein CMG61_04825 [Candidatus Marinimicrobia bacterium]|nr:hypothetical protein [Candidatus Neomarinimicrobiota bacterium]